MAHDPERGLRVTGPLYHTLGRPRPPGRELAAHSRTRTPKSRSWKTLAAVRRRSVERALAPHNHGSLANHALGCSWQVRRALLKRRSMCRRARCHSVSPQSHHRANRKRRHSAEEKESIACRSSHTHTACSSSCEAYPGSVLPCCSQSEHPHSRGRWSQAGSEALRFLHVMFVCGLQEDVEVGDHCHALAAVVVITHEGRRARLARASRARAGRTDVFRPKPSSDRS